MRLNPQLSPPEEVRGPGVPVEVDEKYGFRALFRWQKCVPLLGAIACTLALSLAILILPFLVGSLVLQVLLVVPRVNRVLVIAGTLAGPSVPTRKRLELVHVGVFSTTRQEIDPDSPPAATYQPHGRWWGRLLWAFVMAYVAHFLFTWAADMIQAGVPLQGTAALGAMGLIGAGIVMELGDASHGRLRVTTSTDETVRPHMPRNQVPQLRAALQATGITFPSPWAFTDARGSRGSLTLAAGGAIPLVAGLACFPIPLGVGPFVPLVAFGVGLVTLAVLFHPRAPGRRRDGARGTSRGTSRVPRAWVALVTVAVAFCAFSLGSLLGGTLQAGIPAPGWAWNLICAGAVVGGGTYVGVAARGHSKASPRAARGAAKHGPRTRVAMVGILVLVGTAFTLPAVLRTRTTLATVEGTPGRLRGVQIFLDDGMDVAAVVANLQAAGVNAIRTEPETNHSLFEALERAGIRVFLDVGGSWGRRVPVANVTRRVREYQNYSNIVAWVLGNEEFNDNLSVPYDHVRQVADAVKAVDARPTIYASSMIAQSPLLAGLPFFKPFDFTDWLGYNVYSLLHGMQWVDLVEVYTGPNREAIAETPVIGPVFLELLDEYERVYTRPDFVRLAYTRTSYDFLALFLETFASFAEFHGKPLFLTEFASPRPEDAARGVDQVQLLDEIYGPALHQYGDRVSGCFFFTWNYVDPDLDGQPDDPALYAAVQRLYADW